MISDVATDILRALDDSAMGATGLENLGILECVYFPKIMQALSDNIYVSKGLVVKETLLKG